MRHIGSLLASIVIGALGWALIGLAQAKLGTVAVQGAGRHAWSSYQTPLILFLIAGLLVGLVAATRISPLGPVLVGIGYLVLQLVYIGAPGFLNWLPRSVFGEHQIWTRPASSGVAAILGMAMLVAVFSVRRWQRWPRRPAAGFGAPASSPGSSGYRPGGPGGYGPAGGGAGAPAGGNGDIGATRQMPAADPFATESNPFGRDTDSTISLPGRPDETPGGSHRSL